MHHADSQCELIVKDMMDIGIDIWQGVLPQNDIVKIQKETEGKLILMGGIDASIIDHKEYDEEVIRREVRRPVRSTHRVGASYHALHMEARGASFRKSMTSLWMRFVVLVLNILDKRKGKKYE